MAVVVVGVDVTGEGQAAVEAGIEEAVRRQADLVLVHHLRLTAQAENVPHRREQAERLLRRAEELAQRAGVAHEGVLEVGAESAASVLLRIADARRADLIVIGTRKRSRVGKALMGSDAQQVILGANTQVLCVRDAQERPPIVLEG